MHRSAEPEIRTVEMPSLDGQIILQSMAARGGLRAYRLPDADCVMGVECTAKEYQDLLDRVGRVGLCFDYLRLGILEILLGLHGAELQLDLREQLRGLRRMVESNPRRMELCDRTVTEFVRRWNSKPCTDKGGDGHGHDTA